MTGFKCCLCRGKAVETHHALYFDKSGAIAGRETAGVHIFPLCDKHHKQAHSWDNWVRSHSNPSQKNRNTPNFYLKLRQGWLIRQAVAAEL